jgi:membrane protease YdiL (CAAX protease family)
MTARAQTWALTLPVMAVGVAFAAAGGDESAQRLLVLLLAAPLIEEAVFRAGVQEFLIRARLRASVCVGATASAFAAVHVVARHELTAIVILVPGILLGLLYQRTRSVWACAALHAVMNAAWLSVMAGQ